MEFSPDKLLEQYIHDFLVSENLHTVAENFARQANFQPRRVAIEGGFLRDCWSVFWDVYSSRLGYQASTSTPHQISSASVSTMPDHNYMVQNMSPSMATVSGPSPSVEEAFSFLTLNPFDLPPQYNQLPQVSPLTPDTGSSRYRKRQANNKQRNPAQVGRAVNNGIVLGISAEPEIVEGDPITSSGILPLADDVDQLALGFLDRSDRHKN